MSAEEVKQLCEVTKLQLRIGIDELENFLNNQSIAGLNPENEMEMQDFYKDFLSDLRQLLVFSEVYYEKLGVCLRRPTFHVENAEKALYETYHYCVNRFFYPKNECYSEEGRYAYTGQDAIRFRKKPTRVVRDITLSLSKIYEQIREILAYYENDYLNRMAPCPVYA